MTRRLVQGSMAVALLLGGCTAKRELTVTQGWVRLAANPGAPAAAYFTVEGGPTADMLVGVSARFAARAEMHRSMAIGDHGMTGMAPLTRVAVPAGQQIVFAPGGRHVMLFGVRPDVKAPGAYAMTFTFASGRVVEKLVNVVGPGDPPRPS